MGYTLATIRVLSSQGAEIHVVHWDHKKRTPFQLSQMPSVTFYARSKLTRADIRNLAVGLSPNLTVVSGWSDKDYLSVAELLRKSSCAVVMGLDGQWKGTPRQYAARLLGKINWLSKYFSHAWVAGTYQYEYARMLGFDRNAIVFDLYSADVSAFHAVYRKRCVRETKYPRRFMFVGRFEPIKGLDVLTEAWRFLGDKRQAWELHLIGHGSLKAGVKDMPGVVVRDFLQPDKLLEEAVSAGCFVLPSIGEPWGVVVHEFAAAGVPLILSDVVGAASAFLISGMNGYTFTANDVVMLAQRMQWVIESSDAQLRSMSEISHKLSHRISPQTSAGNLLSVIERSRQ